MIASLAIASPAAAAADCAGADALPVMSSVGTAKAATLCLLNGERTARGLAPLTSQATLEAVATRYSLAMVQQRFFAHISPAGESLTRRIASYISGARSYAVGENLAWGEGARAPPSAIVKGWMASPAHRANILKGAFDQIGIGIVSGTPVGSPAATSATYTTEFGSRTPGPSSSTRSTAAATDPVARPASHPVSAKRRAQISRRCQRVARRTKSSKKDRQARYQRCVRGALRAAAR